LWGKEVLAYLQTLQIGPYNFLRKFCEWKLRRFLQDAFSNMVLGLFSPFLLFAIFPATF